MIHATSSYLHSMSGLRFVLKIKAAILSVIIFVAVPMTYLDVILVGSDLLLFPVLMLSSLFQKVHSTVAYL
jgi:hypothetical protein